MMGDHQRDGYTLDEALSIAGFGTFQRLALVFAGFGWFADAMEITLISFIGPALKSEWSLSPTEESFLSTAAFSGMLVGACFWGLISDVYGRRVGIRGVAIVISGAGLASAFSPDYKSLVILRSFLGFGAAGGHVFSSWFMEFIPSSNRGAWILVLSSFWILGELFETLLAWIVMPRMGWRWLLVSSSIPSLVALSFSIFIPESPRHLFGKGRINEAIQVLENVYTTNQIEFPPGNLVSDESFQQLDEETPYSPCSEETHLLSSTKKVKSNLEASLKSLCELFSSNLLKTTLLLWTLHFVCSFAYYGLQLMISALSSGNSDCNSPPTIISNKIQINNNLYINAFITNLAEFPGLLLGILLVDWLGRKLSIGVLTMLAVILILPLLALQNGTLTITSLVSSRMFLSAAFSILGVYAKEVYPTSVRASGCGFATAVGRVGGMVCPLVAVGLVRECHQTLATIIFGILMIVSGSSVLFFPLETKGKGLKDVVNNSP